MKFSKSVFFICFIILVSNCFSQEQKSIHQLEWEQHRALKNNLLIPDVFDNSIIPLQKSQAQLSKKVFGFLPDWEYPEALDNLRFDLLTHISAFDFTVAANGSIANPAGWPWTTLINTAHNNGVKVILTAVNFDKDQIHGIITNSTIKNNFFSNLKSKIELYNLDGVNIDFEGLNSSDRGAPIVNFMADLTDFLHSNIPGSEVSFDGPAVNWGGYWDLEGLANACDYIFIMGYAFAGSWSTVSASTAPLTGGSYNITNTVLSQYAAITNNNPEKLILGVPYYGHRWRTKTGDAHADTLVPGYATTFYRNAVSGYKTNGTLWDTETSSPWYRYQSSGDWYQVWCENSQSMDQKFDLADANNLLGVGMWALNYDGNSNDFWNQLALHYSSEQPLPNEPQNFRISALTYESLRVSFEETEYATGYWIYISSDGLNFSDSIYATSNSTIIENLGSNNLYFAKVRAANGTGLGPASGVLAATTHGSNLAQMLIIDGFDRQAGTFNTRDYIRMHAQAFYAQGISIASSVNEAVITGNINLDAFEVVDWMLGDESTDDDTFAPVEQAKVKSYLEMGGKLFVSGAEIGWDLARGSSDDKAFYENYLKAAYIDDAPNGSSGLYYSAEGISGTPFSSVPTFNFDNGDHGTYDVDWPDAIRGKNGGMLGMKFNGVSTNNGAAGVYYDGTFGNSANSAHLVYLSMPFETIYPEINRNKIAEAVLSYFDLTSGLKIEDIKQPLNFYLLPNMPNPFNPQTTLRFYSASGAIAQIRIFNMRGQQIFSSGKLNAHSGINSWIWHGQNQNGKKAASGIYIYQVKINSTVNEQHFLSGKMNLIR